MSNELRDILMLLNISENEIIWEMHKKKSKTSIFIIITQVILLVIQIIIQSMLRNVKTGFNNLSLGSILGLVITIFIWILLAISIFNQHINSKAWREAVEKSDRLFRGEEKNDNSKSR